MLIKCAGVAFSIFLLAILCAFAGCRNLRRPLRGDGSRKESSSGGNWFGFTPYPSSRSLCDEYVAAFSGSKPMEIHWATFATSDAAKRVIVFYTRGENGEVELEGESLTVRRGNPVESVLSVQPAAANRFHTCANQPAVGETTVIEVSQILRP